MSVDALPGLDLDRLAAWLRAAAPDSEIAAGTHDGLDATLVAGGKSNLTYEVHAGDGTWILRRPPLGHVLATAHDMAREYAVITALRGTDVPVPRGHVLCTDPDVLGAPFYLMERIEGTPYRRADQLRALGPERTRRISTAMVDTLAALHRVDPASVGLAGLGRPEGYLGRQVGRWRRQMDASLTRDLPAADRLHGRLEARVPAGSVTAIVHGDFRLDNLLVDDGDRVAAVVDWEMATLGDPLADLALMLLYHGLGHLLPGGGVTDAAAAEGFLSETDLVARYAEVTGADLSRLAFCRALAAYKLAAILEGILARHRQGLTVGDGFADLGDSVQTLLDLGLDALEEH